jgi:ubiquinone/menaquinone biosynthesis C-methylase UbiE
MSIDLYSEIDRDSFRKNLLKYSRKAFRLLPQLDKPHILDVGCGSGVPTVELAIMSNGNVVGIDIDPFLLQELNRKIQKMEFSSRVKTKRCSMLKLDFPDESFHIIWVEGAIRTIGFERGLKSWRRLLKTNGFLVVHEEIRTVANDLEKISSFGYKLLAHFLLPEDAHWIDYYKPLENRIKELFHKYKNNSEARRILKKLQNEINMVKRNPKDYRSGFYLMQKI